MSRDYKKPEPRGRTGAMLLGVFLGLVLGLVAALAIAFYLNRAASPFTTPSRPTQVPVPGKANSGGLPNPLTTAPAPARSASPAGPAPTDAQTAIEAPPRFDFYRILPGVDQPVTDDELRRRSAEARGSTQDLLFLQAGAFRNPKDADNLKARLALMGLEAGIQTAALGEKGTWYRVRLGPFDDPEALGEVRSRLVDSGIDAAPIKVQQKKP